MIRWAERRADKKGLECGPAASTLPAVGNLVPQGIDGRCGRARHVAAMPAGLPSDRESGVSTMTRKAP